MLRSTCFRLLKKSRHIQDDSRLVCVSMIFLRGSDDYFIIETKSGKGLNLHVVHSSNKKGYKKRTTVRFLPFLINYSIF
jgi:hypothetical protein